MLHQKHLRSFGLFYVELCIPAIITNCSNNYGPRQHPEKLIQNWIYNILNNKNLPIYGKGLNSENGYLLMTTVKL